MARSFIRFARSVTLWAIAGALLLEADIASAQQRTFYLDRLQVSGTPDDGLVVWRPYMHEKTRFYGTGTLGYTLNPLRAGTVTDDPGARSRIDNPLRHQLIAHLSAGAEIMNRFTVGLTLPVTVFQEGGRDPQIEGIGGGLGRNPVALNDLRFDGRVKVYEDDSRKLRLGVGMSFWLPTGSTFSFGGDDQATVFPYGNAEYDFGKFMIAGHMGPHFRPNRGIAGENGVLEVGSELRWAFGAFVPLRGGDIRIGGSLWGSTGIQSGARSGESTFFGSRNTDLEWLGEIRTWVSKTDRIFFNGGGGTRLSAGYGAPDLRLIAQIGTFASLEDFAPGQTTVVRRRAPKVAMYDKDTDGDGYPDDIDLCPTLKEDGLPPDPTDGCPAMADRDGDGIPDAEDKCPDDPEDKDGIQDYDGCPETDADNDGIPDTEDACPTQGGVKSDDPKKHGCPRQGKKIIETDSEVQLLEPIQFEHAKSTIKAVSFPILDEVVEVLKARPGSRMAVHGHTDSTGPKALNMRLSRERAASVLRYIVNKGIAKNRLESEGYGPDKPVDTNDTEQGRAKNRRVEFRIIE